MTTEPPHPQAPPPAGSARRVFGSILIVVAAFVLSLILFGILRGAGLSVDSSEAVAAFAGSVAILGLGLWARLRLPAHERRQVLAPKRPLAACVLAGLGLAIVLRIVVGIVVAAGEQVDPSLCDDLLSLDEDVPTVLWHKLLLTIALVVLAPVGEELVFRGLLLRGLARRMSFPAAAGISGVLFAVLHPQYWTIWPLLIGISIFGVVAAYVYRRFGYPASVMMHVFFNAVAAVGLFVDLGTEDPSCR